MKRPLKLVMLVVLVLASILGLAVLNILKSTSLTNQITLISPRLSTLGANVLVYKKGDTTMVVDSQLPALSFLVNLKIDQLDKDDHIVITHWHPDHSGGLVAVGAKASRWAHPATRARLATNQIGHDLTAPGSVHHFDARPEAELPDHFVESRVLLSGAELVHYPGGHTEGDLVVFFPEENVVAIGDLLWPGSSPFVDIHTGGSVTGLLAALDAIGARITNDTIIVPGHGSPVSGQALIAYREKITASVEALACVKNLSAVREKWQSLESPLVPIERWIEMLNADPQLRCRKEGG